MTDDCEGEYEVEYVRASRVIHGKRQYLIHWKGYSADSDTWEPESSLDNCTEAIQAFWDSTRKVDKIKPIRKVCIIGSELRQGSLVYSIVFSMEDTPQLVTTRYLQRYYPFELLDYLTHKVINE